MMNKMGEFVALLNIGAIGIGYYSKIINNKDNFDGYIWILLYYKNNSESFKIVL